MKHDAYYEMKHDVYYGDIVCPECQSIKLYENGYTEKGELKLGCENCGLEFKENDCLIDTGKRFFDVVYDDEHKEYKKLFDVVCDELKGGEMDEKVGHRGDRKVGK